MSLPQSATHSARYEGGFTHTLQPSDRGAEGTRAVLTDIVVQFRRSVKSEKHDSAKPVQISIPQKDAIAIEPPKKVRRELSIAHEGWFESKREG